VNLQPRPAGTSKPAVRLCQLSDPLKVLVRLCQWIDYGQILELHVRDKEPVYDPPPTLLLDIKLDADASGRPESKLADFALCDELCRLLDRFDQMENGRIERIEVRAGIPRRILIEARVTECVR
jgi:hypothetical protein